MAHIQILGLKFSEFQDTQTTIFIFAKCSFYPTFVLPEKGQKISSKGIKMIVLPETDAWKNPQEKTTSYSKLKRIPSLYFRFWIGTSKELGSSLIFLFQDFSAQWV